MKQSKLFTKTRKEAPKDEVSKNAQLLIRAGFIHKEMAGVYSFLPLGLRVFEKIENIIREEMNAIGGQELHMPSLQDPNLWKKTGRWDDDVDGVWFKTELSAGGEVGLGWTHEEVITNIMTEHVNSYRDLPLLAYQFQTKFRNEVRAKSGIMRTREFVMKDMYSFARNEKEHNELYKAGGEAYARIFERFGLGDVTFQTFASGGAFSAFSHEFQTISDAGEDIIYISDEKKLAVNKKVYRDDVLEELGLSKSDLREEKSIEVGNIFSLGTRFSDALNLKYSDEKGVEHPVLMGSYGIGPARSLGTIVEVFADEKGIVWPESVAPFSIHLINLSQNDEKVASHGEELYKKLTEKGIEVLYDDRDLRAGEKFVEADLIGIPHRVIVSGKTMKEGKYELTNRKSGETEMVLEEKLFSL